MGKAYFTPQCIMSQNDHAYFKNLVVKSARFFKVYLIISKHNAVMQII